MKDSIFTKIVKGEIPCYKIYEDDLTLAFLDIHPLVEGHVLVIPKLQVDHFDDMPEEDYQAVFATVRKVAKRIKEVYGSERSGIMVEGHGVPHAHVHVFPLNSSISFYEALEKHVQDIKSGKPLPEPDSDALSSVSKRLAF